MKKRELKFILILIVMVQIFLLVSMTFANSYIIDKSENLIEKNIDEKDNYLIKSGINLLIGFLSIKEIGVISAQLNIDLDVEVACCADTCNDVTIIDGEPSVECNNIIGTTCDSTSECSLGCCYDSNQGICSTNSPKSTCEENGGEWNSDKTCSQNECRKGCCVLGGESIFTEEQNCKVRSEARGFETDWRQIWSEIECSTLSTTQAEGACLFSGGACKFTSESGCLADKGRFVKGFLCSAEELGTNCEKQNHVGCVDGKENIYWFDSCGNRENIYSYDKTLSWNGGRVLSEEESCNPDSDNINSVNCGNCKFPLSTCSEVSLGTHVQNGNFVCKDLGCDNAPANGGKTQDRIHGEKWCLYDGVIGNGLDPVGSEQWLTYCYEGEVKIEPRRSEFRSWLCQEQTIEGEGISFTQASYVGNEADKCLSYNPLEKEKDGDIVKDEEKVQACENNEHCRILNVDPPNTDYFGFSMCVPEYPKGAELKDEVDENMCSTVGVSCKVIYAWGLLSGWDCEENCGCESKEFAKEMNNLCISLGDCGSNINYLGGGSDNVNIKGKKGKKLDSNGEEKDEKSDEKGDAPKVYSWTNYKSNVNSVSGGYVKPQNINEFIEATYGESGKAIETITGVSGAAGLIFAGVNILGKGVTSFTLLSLGESLGTITIGSLITPISLLTLGVAGASWIANLLGMSGGEAISVMIAGGAIGLGIALIQPGLTNTWNALGWGLVLSGIVIVVLVAIFGKINRETRIVEFECLPWEAPTENYNCGDCKDSDLIPCTKYRCESIGQACILINEDDEENRACVKMEHESNSPILSPVEVVTEGYEFTSSNFDSEHNIEINGVIKEFEPIVFKLKSDEYAQCKYSFEIPSSPSYNEMEGDYPLEKNLYTKEHTFGFNVPGVDEIEGDKLDVYIKCQDRQDPPNYNPYVYVVRINVEAGPDETAVKFNQAYTEPKNGGVLKYGTLESDLKIWLPEDADCSYDTIDKDYESMLNPMTCLVKEVWGWPCEVSLKNLNTGENKFYIRCKDTAGNVNTESYEYSLFVSQNELQINSVSLSSNILDKKTTISSGGNFKTNLVPISIELKVESSAGAKNGESTCWWGVKEDGQRWLMSPYYIPSKVHTQIIPKIDGEHIIYLECKDGAENEAKEIIEFSIELDEDAPRITRAYKKAGNLKLITNEESKCYYSYDSCYFDLEKGNSITNLFSTEHETKWNPGLTYYVKCKDLFDNRNNDCAITIIPSE